MDTSMTIPPPPVQIRTPNPLVRALRAPFEAQTWKETIHLLLNMPIGIATFTIVVTGFALGFGVLITLVGIPILTAMLYVSRGMGWFERGRAKLLLDLDVPLPYRPDPASDRWWRVPVSRLTDPATWTEIVYHLLLLPVGVITFTIVFTFWAVGGLLLIAPFAPWWPDSVRVFDAWIQITVTNSPHTLVLGPLGSGSTWVIDTPSEFVVISLIGLLILFLTPWVVRGVATANRALVRGMLGSDVTERVRELTASRSAAVDPA